MDFKADKDGKTVIIKVPEQIIKEKVRNYNKVLLLEKRIKMKN